MEYKIMEITKEMLDHYRDINVMHDDWDEDVKNDFTAKLATKGIVADAVYWTGFWSQGDGACFEGYVDDMTLFMDTHFTADEYPMVRMLAQQDSRAIHITCRHVGRYYHYKAVSINIEVEEFSQHMDTPSEFHEQIIQSYDTKLSFELVPFEKDVVEIFEDYMKDLYKDLEAQYEYLTSDKAVKEAIIDNEYHINYEENQDGNS